jgi:SMC interacting uncharacterized protein involved in chromosome segregation
MEPSSQFIEFSSQGFEIKVNEDPQDENFQSTQSEFNDTNEELSHLDRLKNMHKAVKFLIKKSQKTRSQLREIHHGMENSFQGFQKPPEDEKNKQILEISGISDEKSEGLGDEIQNLEKQISVLRKKLKNNEESLDSRKGHQTEVKKLLIDLDRIQKSTGSRNSCDCRSCVTF